MTDRIFVADTLVAAATAAAAVATGLYEGPGRRVLLLVDASEIPEVSAGLDALPGFGTIADRFDRVGSLNELIAPFHPVGWAPGRSERNELRARLRAWAGVSSDTALTLPDSDLPLFRALVAAFPHRRSEGAQLDLIHATPDPAVGSLRDETKHLTRRFGRILALASAPSGAPNGAGPFTVVHAGEFTGLLRDASAAGAGIAPSANLGRADSVGSPAYVSPWRQSGLPAPIARLLPDRWFAPVRRWARARLFPLVVRRRRRRQRFTDIALPELTREDFSPRR